MCDEDDVTREKGDGREPRPPMPNRQAIEPDRPL